MSERATKYELPNWSPDIIQRREAYRKQLDLLKMLYPNPVERQDFIIEIQKQLLNRYPNAANFYAYHDLIGSSFPTGVTEFDMPDSEIAKFVARKMSLDHENEQAA